MTALDPYAALGLEPSCTPTEIRNAYRQLAKRWHPDRNAGSDEANEKLRALNAAYEILIDPARRAGYHRERGEDESPARTVSRAARDVTQDVRLGAEDFLRGTRLTVHVNDPANPNGREIYSLEVPAETAPGTRIRVPRDEPFAGGSVIVRLKLMPGGRFKASGSDLRCDLRISASRAAAGGTEMIAGPTGRMLRVTIPARIGRNEVVRIAGEGLPRPRGGRGDLLVRVIYRPEVRVTRG